MLKLRPQKHAQEEIFADYSWWEPGCLLLSINEERCDYIESAVERVFGKEALRQQEVLEIGCGGGLICENLARRGAVSYGIDPNRAALQAACDHTRVSGVGQITYFMQGYAERLPFADGCFSVIVCMDVLEHVRDLKATIHEVARVLAPGGVFVFDTINRTFIARLALIWIGERFFQSRGLLPGLHEYSGFIKPHELHSIITQNSLQVQEMTGFMPRLHKGRLGLGPGWFKGVSYVGYATKGRP